MDSWSVYLKAVGNNVKFPIYNGEFGLLLCFALLSAYSLHKRRQHARSVNDTKKWFDVIAFIRWFHSYFSLKKEKEKEKMT